MVTAGAILELDYKATEGLAVETCIKKLDTRLQGTPTYGIFSPDQKKCIIASANYLLLVDLETGLELDIAAKESVQQVLAVLADHDTFYVLANKKNSLLGYYLFIVNTDNARGEYEYLIQWTNKLGIAGADLRVMQNTEDGRGIVDQLVVSFKNEGINTYNVFVFDIKTRYISLWYEVYQLYELPTKGFILTTKDFLIMSNDGINIINVGKQGERQVNDFNGDPRMMHPLGSVQYLKLESTNHIHFKCQFYDNRRICIQDQAIDDDKQTQFTDIYKIKIHEPTLRELMTIYSIYCCRTGSDIAAIVALQPTPLLFFKVFLELELKNLLSYLAFSQKAIQLLLGQDVGQYVDAQYPLFYPHQHKPEHGRSSTR